METNNALNKLTAQLGHAQTYGIRTLLQLHTLVAFGQGAPPTNQCIATAAGVTPAAITVAKDALEALGLGSSVDVGDRRRRPFALSPKGARLLSELKTVH